MKETRIVNESRRNFIRYGLAAGTGLTLGVYFPSLEAQKMMAGPGEAGAKLAEDISFEPNAFVRIGADDTVTVIVKHIEFGQGTYTGLPTLVAEELDAAWSQIRVVGAPANAKLYNNLLWGQIQGTGGSSAMANSFEQMRKAGASARAMLVTAAAKLWSVPAYSLSVNQGVILHKASGKRVSFGELAQLAATQPVPAEVRLKSAEEFIYIGKQVPRTDSKAKTNGTAIYTQDIKLPGMLTALVVHPPRFGSKLKSFDATPAKAVQGVEAVVPIPSGVAVLAKDFWSAKKGREKLEVQWDESRAFKLGSQEILAEYKRLAQKPGRIAHQEGDVDAAMARASKLIEATYEFPYLAHATMEPMNCVVRLGENSCEIWNGEQVQTIDQMAVASALGLKPEQVKITMLYAGGSFGRRANPASDYVLEAALIAKAIKGNVPVKLVWTREDDTRAGYYRPLYYHALKAGLDTRGALIAWQHRIVGQSILKGTAFESALVKDGIDMTSVEGAADLPYTIPNRTMELHTTELGVPVQWWRSVGHTHTAFSTETFLDEIAATAGKDPVALRRALLANQPRSLGVMELAAKKAGWGTPLPKGRGRGIAVHESFNSYVAEVAEVSLEDRDTFRVDRVVIAVDCGLPVNPDIIRAQMEGGMGYGLSAALSGEITLKAGMVEQSNFHDYTVLRINQMPEVEVHIVPSTANPTGVGEPGVPPIAPAVANALFAAGGQRFHKLPIQLKV
jgi:isoquinoline 1-oxidoreductase beta subunit